MWQGISKNRPSSRTKLLSIYLDRYDVSQSWNDLAHIGLLKINLGKAKKHSKPGRIKSKSSHAIDLRKMPPA